MELILAYIQDFIHDWFFQPIWRIKTVIRYMKIGWNTHDFDYDFPLREFLDKLEHLAAVLKKNNYHENALECSEQITKAVKLIRTSEDDCYYHDSAELPIIKKYGERLHYEARADGFGNWNKKIFKKGIACVGISRREKETYDNYKDIQKMERKAYQDAYTQQQRDWNIGWDIITENIQRWWD